MKNTKHQTPNTKKIANSKSQTFGVNYPELGAGASEVSVLRDEPPAQKLNQHPFDMEERTAVFGEANDCFSKKDFRFNVKRCMKEAKEPRLFLRMIAVSEPQLAEEARALYLEATELLRILATMYRK